MNNSGLRCECPSYSKNARATNIKCFSFVSLKGVKVRRLQLLLIVNTDCSFNSRKQNQCKTSDGISHSAVREDNYGRGMKRKENLYSNTRHLGRKRVLPANLLNGKFMWISTLVFGMITLPLLWDTCLSLCIHIWSYRSGT